MLFGQTYFTELEKRPLISLCNRIEQFMWTQALWGSLLRGVEIRSAGSLQ